ncbi:MAG: type IV pilus assembly protein PilM [Solirubrobacterales bacterium]
MQISTRKSTTVVGLDIEAGSVAATEVRTNGDVQLGKTGIAALAPGVTSEGEVIDEGALSDSLKALFAERKLSRNVRVGIANQRVVVRMLRLPVLEKREEIEAAIRFHAADQIPMPLDQAVVDWQVLDSDPAVTLDRKMDVVVVAARRDSVAGLARACRRAGLKPIGIDVAAFAMIRALAGAAPVAGSAPSSLSYEERIADGGSDASVAVGAPARLLCNLGDVTNLAVASGSRCLFTRVSSFGMEGVAQRVAERRGLTLEHARTWLVHVGLDRPPASIDGDSEIIETCREALVEGGEKLAGELRLSLDFYGSQEGAVAVEEIVLCGHGTAIDGLAKRLGQELGYPVSVSRPTALSGLDEATASRLTLAYGLALER